MGGRYTGPPWTVRLKRGWLRVGFLLPLGVLYLAVIAYPLIWSVWLSFTDLTITRPDSGRFVGLAQYRGLLENRPYIASLRNTFLFVVAAVTLELVAGFALAVAVRRQRLLRNLTRSFLLTPMFVTPIAVGLMFRYLLNQQLGLIPQILSVFGVSIDFFGSDLALASLIGIDVWQWTPFMMLLLLAGLESLPTEPFEAARVDGASPWFVFRRVTLPLMTPVVAVAVLIRALDAFKVFEYVFAITQGGPGTATETLQLQVYKTGFRFFRLGEASAMAFVLVVIVFLIVVLLYRRLSRP